MRGRNILRNMFGLDWRSLALMRIGLALVVLTDVAISARSLGVFYSNEGVLSTQVVRDNYAPDFTLYLWHGSPAYVTLLFGLEAVFALMMLVGYRTRLATMGCWFMLMSRQARNPLIMFGADMIEHIALFWAMWLPLNRYYSLDAWLGRVKQPREARYLSMTSFGVILQFMLIYVVSGIAKSGPTWHVEHSAVYYALSVQMYSRPFGQWLNQYDWLTAWLTIGTLYLELYGPLLFILPFRWGWGRLLGFAIFGVLQIGFGVSMQMGLFWVVMNAFMLMLLPEEFWTWLAEPLGRWIMKRWRQPSAKTAVNLATDAPLVELPTGKRWLRLAGKILHGTVMAAIVVYMLLLNYDTLPGHAPTIPDNWRWPATDSGLEQRFDMFAPDPQQYDGWYVIRGQTVNGKEVDILTGESPPSYDPPASIADSLGDERWCSYLLDLSFDDLAPYRQYYAEYLGRAWNNRHPASEQLANLEIVFMRSIHGPNHTMAGPTAEVLWEEDF